MEPKVRGRLAEHPAARALAAEVARVHLRYGREVVGAWSLCPFLKDAETAFGAFFVLLDPEPTADAVVACVLEAKESVGHVVCPLARAAPSPWERLSNAVGEGLRARGAGDTVLAAFHPDLAGDVTSAHRLVGLLRHAPDPFIQFVPAGLAEGGTTLGGYGAKVDPADANFARLASGGVEQVLSLLADIRADRDRSYAPFLAELGS